MYLMYVDESGDPGMVKSPTRFFALSGVVVHELSWRSTMDRLIAFRGRMRKEFTLKLREEIHAAQFINDPGEVVRIPKYHRLVILRQFADEIAALPDVSVINVVVDKQGKAADFAVLETAWRALLQRFENTMQHRNFPGPANADDRGFVFPDGLPSRAIRGLLRRMRHYNPVPSQFGGYRRLELTRVIEDPCFRDSQDSLLIQAADLCCFLSYQYMAPNAYMRRKKASEWIFKLEPVLCRKASPHDHLGVVRL